MIQFGNWQVRRSDPLNLQLYHRHVMDRGKHIGEMRWRPTGHFFQSVKAAVTYALNVETMERVGDESLVLSLRDAIEQEERIAREFQEWLSEAAGALPRPD